MAHEDQRLEAAALQFIKTHKEELIERFCPQAICHPVNAPVSLFMAGSPGAGKTEVSKGLINKFNDTPVRVDADEIRSFCLGYTGTNAHLFQKAANKGVNMLYDHALHHKNDEDLHLNVQAAALDRLADGGYSLDKLNSLLV